jgi:hypothetical protein
VSFFYPSITSQDKTEPFELQVTRGMVAGHKPLFKFGLNSDIDSSFETIWSHSSLYVYPTTAAVMKVSSTSADDAAAGTGARTVLVAVLL